MLKVLVLLYYVLFDWLKNLRHFLNQSDAKLKPMAVVTWSHARFPALGAGYVYLLRVLIGLIFFPAVVIGQSDYFGWFCYTQLKTALKRVDNY